MPPTAVKSVCGNCGSSMGRRGCLRCLKRTHSATLDWRTANRRAKPTECDSCGATLAPDGGCFMCCGGRS